MVFGSVANSFRCAFLRGIECFLLQKNISNFAEATREKLFTTMTPLGMSRDVRCHRLWRHNCFLNSIQFELIYFISIWTSQNWLKIRTFLCIIKRNELFDHPSYIVLKAFYRLLHISFLEVKNVAKKNVFEPDRGQFVKSEKKCVFLCSPSALKWAIGIDCKNLKVLKDSFFQIPISALIVCGYRMLRSPCCVTVLW